MPIVIGIGAGLVDDPNYRIPGYPRMTLNVDYARSVEAAGAVPLVLPLVSSADAVRAQIRGLDAVILSGGSDLDPATYGQSPDPRLGEITPARDAYEGLLIDACLEQQLPILGICRGMQILNVHCGGTLLQDVALRSAPTGEHTGDSAPTGDRHAVTLTEESWLGTAIGRQRIDVNSIHHQVIDGLAAGFTVTARADDGVIEGIEHRDGATWMAGVQWHPEMISADDPAAAAVFSGFVEVARGRSRDA